MIKCNDHTTCNVKCFLFDISCRIVYSHDSYVSMYTHFLDIILIINLYVIISYYPSKTALGSSVACHFSKTKAVEFN